MESDGIRGSTDGLRNNSARVSARLPSKRTSLVRKRQLDEQLPDGTRASRFQPGSSQLCTALLGLFPWGKTLRGGPR